MELLENGAFALAKNSGFDEEWRKLRLHSGHKDKRFPAQTLETDKNDGCHSHKTIACHKRRFRHPEITGPKCTRLEGRT